MGRRETVHRIEPFWDAQIAIAAVIVLDATLPAGLVLDVRWAIPAVGGGLLLTLMVITPWNAATPPPPRSAAQRRLALGMLALVIGAHLGSLTALIVDILDARDVGGGALLRAAAQLWLSTVLIFAVLFWELDRGGPVARSQNGPVPRPPPEGWSGPWPDLLFPQMADDAPVPGTWMPGFVDYLYLAATNSTAFSPTDVLPLSAAAKLLMLAQSTTSFIVVALVAARAVDVLA
jgi:hypothetical protein